MAGSSHECPGGEPAQESASVHEALITWEARSKISKYLKKIVVVDSSAINL